MRVLLATVVLAALGYGAYWHIAARSLDAQITATLAHGQAINVADYTLGGFPHRFDVTLNAPRLHLPNTTVTWQGDVLNIHALSYQPHHVIAVFPAQQNVTLLRKDWVVRSPDARASLVAAPMRGGALDRANLVFDAPEFTQDMQVHRADSLRAGLTHISDAQYQLALDLPGLRPDPAVRAALGDTDTLPPLLARSRIMATLEFDAPLQVNRPLPAVQDINVTDAEIIWGEIGLQVTGRLQPDLDGTLSGQLDLHITNWDQGLALLVAGGLIDSDAVQMAHMMLTAMSDRETGQLQVPVQVRQSVMSLGPLVLGQLPRL
ncbi:DUF2125 domain-containing protein [Roseinatronobacter sp. NSM]|uniref:DUF2125 domain-containing protein n=1 Tax=Roseinatronobacter sp. NSM TaxID=3457785 RepID=UPI0040354DA7